MKIMLVIEKFVKDLFDGIDITFLYIQIRAEIFHLNPYLSKFWFMDCLSVAARDMGICRETEHRFRLRRRQADYSELYWFSR